MVHLRAVSGKEKRGEEKEMAVMSTEGLGSSKGEGESKRSGFVARFLGRIGVERARQEWAYVLNNNDWPSEIPGPNLSKSDFYDVLKRVPDIYPEAMADLANTQIDSSESLPVSPTPSPGSALEL